MTQAKANQTIFALLLLSAGNAAPSTRSDITVLLPRAKAGAREGGQAVGAASRSSRNDDGVGKAIAEQEQATLFMAADMAMIQLAALENRSTVVVPGARGAAWKLSVTPSVTAFGHFSSVVKSDGTLWTVGSGWSGELGTGDQQDRATFTQVMTGVQAASAGQDHQVALKSDGSVWATGRNRYGQLGDQSVSNRLTFTQVLTGAQAVSAGWVSTAVLKSDGTVWTAGRGLESQLGTSTWVARSSFTQVFTGAQAVATGDQYMAVLKSDGTVWSMGAGTMGQLGSGQFASKSTFVQVASGAQALEAGPYHMMMLKGDGTAWATGDNYHGQLGIGVAGMTASRNTFAQAMAGVQAVSVGMVQSALVKADGTLWTCGFGSWDGVAVLGDGSTASRSTFAQVLDGAQGVAQGEYHTVVLKSEGTVWAIGMSYSGQLGTGDTASRGSFVQVLDAQVPTSAPTAAPTAVPTVPPTAAPASAKGDPHLTNVLGERFDLMQPGVHVLVHIPRSAKASHTLLKIIAEVDHLGAACMDIFIQAVNVTGKWVFKSTTAGRRPRDIYFKAGQMPSQGAHWLRLGEVSLKVKEGRTNSGTRYLNVMVRDLSKVSKYNVGGLLGQDDHTLAATPVQGCVRVVDI